MNKNLSKAAFVVAVLGLTACSSEPAKTPEAKTETMAAKKPAGPPEPVTGKTAFYEMYTPAHSWAADMAAISLRSGEVKGVKNTAGKAGMWTAVFGSPSLKMARTYTYAVAEDLPAVYKGVKVESTDPWAGPTTAALTIDTSEFTIDSDGAYKAAADKAGDWLKNPENASKPVSMSLGAASRFPAPVWYILFGDTKSGFYAYVNAATGNIIAK